MFEIECCLEKAFIIVNYKYIFFSKYVSFSFIYIDESYILIFMIQDIYVCIEVSSDAKLMRILENR